jgi:hypothetical protein
VRYSLTGPRTVAQAEQVQAIGDTLGRNLRWKEIAPEHVHDQLSGTPDTALDTWASLVATPEVVTPAVRGLTCRPARSFAEWAHDHTDDFR